VSAPESTRKTIGDLKAGLTSHKTDATIIGMHAEDYQASGMAYGADKYAKGNYYGSPPEGVDEVDRYLGYIAAAQRHLRKVCQAIVIAKGTGGDQRAACAVTDDEPGKDKAGNITFPASGLPHIAHALASLMILVEVGVMDGLLPAFPGRPWTRDPEYAKVLERRGKRPAEALAQKNDPDSERARIAALMMPRTQAEPFIGLDGKRTRDLNGDSW
jgi:hypothetical protein